MKIKTQFIICIVVFTIILVIIGASVATSTQRVAGLKAQENVANNIQRGAGNLSSISVDYFLYQQDTSIGQWQANFSSLSRDLSTLKLNNNQQQQLATNISRDLQGLNATFGEVVSYLRNTPRTVSVRELQPFQDRWGNMTDQNQLLNLDASQMSISFDTEAHQANDTNTVLIVSLVVAFGALLATIYLLVFRRTLRSVAELQNGINTVSSGNLDYVIETKRQDEVSELSYAFNQMTANRKVAEEKLLAASLYARSLLEASLDPLVTISEEGKITDVNKATEDVTGCSREELIGSDFSDYFTAPEQARAGYQKVFTEGLVKDYPLAIRSKSGRITAVLYNATVYLNPQGEIQGVFAAARDVTERKAMENEIKLAMEKLQQSNAELEQFAYVASHDLQEPLRMVASYVQLIERRYKGKLDSDADEFIGYAVDGANRMRGLIDDLLTYSRVSRLGKPFEITDLESTLEIVLLNLKTSIAENEALVTHDKLPTVMADGGQLVQLFQNLIGNGIKFHGEEAPHVHISVQVRDTDYLFSVRDNGIGIAPEYYDRLFKIFQRLHTREEYPGSGIGLAVCKRIVERHGGQIWIDSQVGKGSTIYFTLSKRKGSNSEK
jgi:PAS domain S-box-containing protein